jgi:rhodanese-related sulfurtransferase
MNTVDHDLKRRMLHSFVPVNALTEDHLDTLLRDTGIEVICRGQALCRRGDRDSAHIFLLSGSVGLDDGGVAPLRIDADDPQARFPLAHHQPRLESVIALTDCQIIRFDSDRLDAMLAWDQAADYIMLDISAQRDMDEDADWMLTLLRSNLFYKVPPMNIRQILSRFQPVFTHAGDAVIRQGELGDCCYFIKEGSVAVYRSDDARSKSTPVAELGVGRCFGEDALVNEAPRNATVLMRENGVLMRLDKQDFYLLLKTPPVRSIGFAELERELAAGAVLIDVRGSDEFEREHAVPALNMPLNILQLKARQLDRNTRYIAYCNSGRRSSAAAFLLTEDGYDVTVLRNGIDALSAPQRLHLLCAGDAAYLAREQQLVELPFDNSGISLA